MDLWLPATDSQAAESFIETARAAGMEEGDVQAFETLRIEAGIPWPGREITPDVLLNELGREEFVSFTKGCYVGQEIVARIKHRAHPPRLLAGFLLSGDSPPSAGKPLSHEGKPVGLLTSVCFSPALKRTLGLGFLQYGFADPACEAAGLTGPVRAERAKLPFVHPSS